MNQPFLVVYEYGSGGIWAYVIAQSRAEIEQEFPELKVVEKPPSWMTPEERQRIRGESSYDIRADRTAGLLAEILDARGR